MEYHEELYHLTLTSASAAQQHRRLLAPPVHWTLISFCSVCNRPPAWPHQLLLSYHIISYIYHHIICKIYSAPITLYRVFHKKQPLLFLAIIHIIIGQFA